MRRKTKERQDEHRKTAGDSNDSETYRDTHLSAKLADEAARKAASITTREDDVPILGFKGYSVAWAPGGKFHLVGFAGPVMQDADAFCHSIGSFVAIFSTPEDHIACTGTPDLRCSCGWYAMRDRDQVTLGGAAAIVDVELSGRVIVAERGFRAEHQRILRIELPACYFCGEDVEAAHVTDFFNGNSQRLWFSCAEHAQVVAPNATISIERVSTQLQAMYPGATVEFERR